MEEGIPPKIHFTGKMIPRNCMVKNSHQLEKMGAFFFLFLLAKGFQVR